MYCFRLPRKRNKKPSDDLYCSRFGM